jgi:hypothetical protein
LFGRTCRRATKQRREDIWFSILVRDALLFGRAFIQYLQRYLSEYSLRTCRRAKWRRGEAAKKKRREDAAKKSGVKKRREKAA